MNRKLVWLLTVLLLAFVQLAGAQQWIGYLTPLSPAADSGRSEAFRDGLYTLGYIEGRHIAFEYRYAAGDLDRLSRLAEELVQLNVDLLIVASSTPGVLAAKKATKKIPIIMINVADPVGQGIIASLARPGGNITGLTGVARDLTGKRLELLKETVPRLSRVSVLWDRSSEGITMLFKEAESVAQAMKVELQWLEVRNPEDFETAFKAAVGGQARALIVFQGPVTATHRRRIVKLAMMDRLPTMFGEGVHVEFGGLMSYGPSYDDLFRRAATYVDKILNGAKPKDLPVEQPTKFELVINLKTAKQIGLTIPPNVLARAEKVIK